MGRKYNYVDIDFAVRVLNHPELIDDEEMRLWLRDEGHCRLLEELRRVREGSLRTVDGLRPDVNLEWEKLSRNRGTQGIRPMCLCFTRITEQGAQT